MSGKSTKASSTVLQKYSVPIQQTDLSIYDGAFASMKQRFAAEMRRMDEEMLKLSKNLLHLTGQTTTVQAGMTSSRENPASCWEVITKSPLLQGEGADKVLNLQFDLSKYSPDEVSVKILNNVLIVSAERRETTDDTTIYTEFNREFLLPAGTDPEAVESMLSKEGVLTVTAQVHIEPPDLTDEVE